MAWRAVAAILVLASLGLPAAADETDELGREADCARIGFLFYSSKVVGHCADSVATAYLEHGIQAMTRGNLPLALADYNKAIALNPEGPYGFIDRGNLYRSQRQFDTALADFNKALELEPHNAVSLTDRGETFLAQRDYRAAERDFNAAIAANPKFAPAYLDRASLSLLQEASQSAVLDLDSAIRLNPALPSAFNNRATAYMQIGDFEKAMADADKAAAIRPQAPQYQAQRCLTRAATNQALETAKQYCDTAFKAQTGAPDSFLLQARALLALRQKNFQQAWDDYDQAQRTTPLAMYYYGRGLAAFGLNRDADAKADIAKAIALRPAITEIYARMGLQAPP